MTSRGMSTPVPTIPGLNYSQFWLGRNSGDPEKMCLLTEIML